MRGNFDIEIISSQRTLFELGLSWKYFFKSENLIRGIFDLEILSSSFEDIEIFSQLPEGKILTRFYCIK